LHISKQAATASHTEYAPSPFSNCVPKSDGLLWQDDRNDTDKWVTELVPYLVPVCSSPFSSHRANSVLTVDNVMSAALLNANFHIWCPDQIPRSHVADVPYSFF
jgi:hypothetical protein